MSSRDSLWSLLGFLLPSSLSLSNPVPTALVVQGWCDLVHWFTFSRAALASTSLGQFLQLPVSLCWKALPSDLLIVKQHWALINKESSRLQGELEVNKLGKVTI